MWTQCEVTNVVWLTIAMIFVQFKNGSAPFMILGEHNFPLTVRDEDW